jgi:hypothetical protein
LVYYRLWPILDALVKSHRGILSVALARTDRAHVATAKRVIIDKHTDVAPWPNAD